MLKLLEGGAPNDLGKKGEITKESGRLDRMTGDTGDLRLYASSDGKKQYLRVWEGPTEGGTARWFECVKPDDQEPAVAASKK